MNKTTTLLSLIILLSIVITSCKPNAKNETETIKTEKAYSVDISTAKIGWTAYKTTDKVAVSGEFTKINIKEKIKTSSINDVLNGVEFSIPVSSIFSNNDIRDGKLKQFFFGIMDNTELLSGKIEISSDAKGSVSLLMNGIKKSFPINYSIEDQNVVISGILNLDDWNTQSAIESLNVACLELHKGADSISKTWSDVKIDVSVGLKYE